jgi:hypothetical protein
VLLSLAGCLQVLEDCTMQSLWHEESVLRNEKLPLCNVHSVVWKGLVPPVVFLLQDPSQTADLLAATSSCICYLVSIHAHAAQFIRMVAAVSSGKGVLGDYFEAHVLFQDAFTSAAASSFAEYACLLGCLCCVTQATRCCWCSQFGPL